MSTKISIITLSCRLDGLKVVEKALSRQTEKSFKWIIGSPMKPETKLDYVWIKDPPKPKNLYWQVYRQYNECLRHTNSSLVISIQDHTFFNPDALQRLWEHFQEEPKTIVSGVGNKYSDDSFLVETWHDPRIKQGINYYECNPFDIELNFAAFPKQAFYDVGGFDEYLDRYSSLCGLDVLDRLNMLGGYKFKIDQGIQTFSTEHGRLPKWEEFNPIPSGIYEKHRESYVGNPKLSYL